MKTYYENENGKLYHGSCMNIIPKLDKVDCVITSPPYNMNLRIRNGIYCSRQITKEISTKYDNFSDNLTMEDYYRFHTKIINLLLHKTDIIFYNVQFLTGNKKALFKIIGTFSEYLKEVIVWDKINCEPAIGAGILNSQFEVILVFDGINSISRKFNDANFERGELSNVWKITRGKKISKKHGAVFPEELISKIIHNFTDPGHKILDPFFGTGTTGLVCEKLDRKFIGIEISEQYCEIAAKRIAAENKQLKLF